MVLQNSTIYSDLIEGDHAKDKRHQLSPLQVTWDNYETLCSSFCNTIENVVGVWAFRETELVASSVKPGFPAASSTEQKKMFVQAHMMIGMAATNRSMYGRVNYVSVSFELVDCYLFPITDEEREMVLAVACVRPYPIDTIKRAVSVMAELCKPGSAVCLDDQDMLCNEQSKHRR